MTTLSLEIPDELAERLEPSRNRLPELLSIVLKLSEGNGSIVLPTPKGEHPVFNEILDFLANGPTPDQIITYKVSPTTQERLETLVEKKREGELTEGENYELEIYRQVNPIFILLKARARLTHSTNNQITTSAILK